MSDGVEQWGIRYRAHNGVPRWAVVVAPARYGPGQPLTAAAARRLSSRPRRARPDEREPLARAPRARRVRGDLSGRNGQASPASLVGLARADRRPRTHAVDSRAARPWLRIDSAAGVRRRRKHGRAGDTPPRGSSSTTPCGRGRVRLGHRLLPTLRRLRRPRPQGTSAAGARSDRGRRDAEHEPAGLPPARPSALVARDRRAPVFRCRSGGATRTRSSPARRTSPDGSHRDLLELDPRGRVEKVTGSWSHTAESYRRLQLPGAVRWLGLVPDV